MYFFDDVFGKDLAVRHDGPRRGWDPRAREGVDDGVGCGVADGMDFNLKPPPLNFFENSLQRVVAVDDNPAIVTPNIIVPEI